MTAGELRRRVLAEICDEKELTREIDDYGNERKVMPIYTADLETDPFVYGMIPEPFVVGFYDGYNFIYFWGEDWLIRFIEHLQSLPKGIIYFHNGGKFDFFYIIQLFAGSMMIRNGRVIKARSEIVEHEFRDSYALMPFALKDYKKDEIDINKLKRGRRDKNRDEIVSYLQGDCVYLHELCTAFRNRFGDRLTIGGTAMRELEKIHTFTKLTDRQDQEIRDKYFYGGRVQCFRKGIVKTPLKVYDVNSMYPSVMKNFKHPIGRPTGRATKISRKTCFISAEGKNYGAFPVRDEDGGIRFDVESGIFHVTIHEWKTAVRFGLFEPRRIIETVEFDNRDTFANFVDTFYNLRKQAQTDGDIILALFYKYVLNSAYGKFAQNVDNFADFQIRGFEDEKERTKKYISGWVPKFFVEDKYVIWERPSFSTGGRYNVATGCSITGAARSVLLEALAQSTNPVYCDTDSIIAESVSGVNFHDKELGAWKHEGDGHTMAIGGKKLYALFGEECPDCSSIQSKPLVVKNQLCRHPFHKTGCVKQANKGVRITPAQIRQVAKGREVVFERPAPSYKLNGQHQFLRRRVNLT